jgi:sugar phosphate isomerase/epimerase
MTLVQQLTRRDWLTSTAGLVAVSAASFEPARPRDEPFGYCFNTSTVMGQKLGMVELIEVAAKAGYTAMEPWIRELDQYAKEGGNLKELGKRFQDRGISVESVIGFSEWIVDDDDRRKKGLEDAKRSLDMIAQVGGKRLAAPPAGATSVEGMPYERMTERYRALLELGDQFGVVPQLEVWGFSRTLRRLGEALMVACDANHPRACILADVYHLYKGGSDFNGLRLLGPQAMFVLHCNDYPAAPTRAEIKDEHRVFPGDGVAPLRSILRDLHEAGFRGYLSLELFNREYWSMDPQVVAQKGIDKMRAAVRQALA